MSIDPVASLEQAANIDSIKEMMDGFDPAALLPDLSSIFGKVELLCRIAILVGPVILLAMGLAYLLLAPKEANHYFGYKCYFGMGSVQAWRFTQRFAGIVLGTVGLILTITMAVISMGLPGLPIPDMVWKSVVCLFWQAVTALLAFETVNLTAMLLFDRKGVMRKQKKEEKLAKKAQQTLDAEQEPLPGEGDFFQEEYGSYEEPQEEPDPSYPQDSEDSYPET